MIEENRSEDFFMIGENIKKLRINAGLTQKDLAEKLFVTAQAVSRWENNDVEPSATTIYEMAKIFNVSIDEIFGNGVTNNVKKEVVVEKEIVYTEPKPIIAVCSQCGKAIYDANEIVRGVRGDKNKPSAAVCKACYDSTLKAEREKRKKEKEESQRYGIKQRNRSFFWGGLITAVVLAIAIAIAVKFQNPGLQAGVIIAALAVFPFVSCLFLKNNFVGEMVMTVISWAFVKFPGIIFSFSLDGFIFLIAIKILFWLIGILLGCAFTILAAVLGLVVSIFVYPFAIVKSFRYPERTEKF